MRAFKSFRRTILIASLGGMAISGVMFFVPADFYSEPRDHDSATINQLLWLLLFIFALFGLIVSAIMYTVRTDDESGPLVIHR